MYLNELKNYHTSFLNVSTKVLLEHFMQWYGKITQLDINNNKVKMEEVFDTLVSIYVYFKRIENRVQYTADGNTPFS